MNNKPLISIIVPIYNVEQYIYKSVESVRNQTYENLEIILVDDGSPDRCGLIADEFAEKDSRIRVIHKKNGGLSDARNAGLKVATGEYIYFFDSDDYIEPILLEKAYEAYEKEDIDLVCFNYATEDEESGKQIKNYLPACKYKSEGQRCNLVINDYLECKIGYCVWNKLYRIDIIRKHQIQFEDNSKVFSEDICFNLYYILYCKNIRMISDTLYYYLIRGSSIMGQSKKEPRMNQYIQISKYYEDYLRRMAPESKMRIYQDIIFMRLMKIQLEKVVAKEREKWIETIEDLKYFQEHNDSVLKGIGRWLEVYGFVSGIKKWLVAIEFYYGTKKNIWIRFLKKLVILIRGK